MGKNIGKVFVTGDTHGNFNKILEFVRKMQTSLNDVLAILGDVGLNYYLNEKDEYNKILLSKLNLTIFCIKGNHEKYPENIPGYVTKEWNGGIVFYEEKYPNILFAKDGEIYNINGKKCLVIGGAYSVDKFYRLRMGWHWFEDEQPSENLKKDIEEKLKTDNKFDYVLTHTCPYSVRPIHLFLSYVDQDSVDSSTELWLEKISKQIEFKKWYFGHYHDDWSIDNYQMLFNGFDILE